MEFHNILYNARDKRERCRAAIAVDITVIIMFYGPQQSHPSKAVAIWGLAHPTVTDCLSSMLNNGGWSTTRSDALPRDAFPYFALLRLSLTADVVQRIKQLDTQRTRPKRGGELHLILM